MNGPWDDDNRANQLNPNNDAYWSSRGVSDDDAQDDLDNYSNQLNPNNDAYWQSRGYSGRPDDWDE